MDWNDLVDIVELQQFYKYITTNEAGMIEEFMRIQKEHYKKSIITKSEILNEINYIKNIMKVLVMMIAKSLS